ncbi:MAG: DNA polymerase Y family protein [Polyangia bacterium]
MACVDLPALPLQLLARRHPGWRERPAAAISADSPFGEVLHVDRSARRRGVLPGMRYAVALSLCPDLRAGVVAPEEISAGVKRVVELLLGFTPEVEPASDEPGVLWLNPTGLGRLYRSPASWARAVRRRLDEDGFVSTLAVGFTRFGTYALARSGEGVIAPRDPKAERRLARRVRLSRLDLSPAVRDALRKLGVIYVGRLLSLPRAGLLERFGPEVERLWRMAAGDLWAPLRPLRPCEPLVELAQLEPPDVDSTRLAFLARRLLAPLLARAAERGEALAELEIALALERGEDLLEGVEPAEPTLDERLLLELVRLRLGALRPGSGVSEMRLTARTVAAEAGQLELFAAANSRDLAAGERALARVRAELGRDAVVRARPSEGHLPEARFRWERLDRLRLPAAVKVDSGGALVRRILERPSPLAVRPVCGPRGIHLGGLENEPVVRVIGPHVISGGWWRSEVVREYHFAETARGRILWVYFDRRRRRWYLHGEVE